MSQIFFYLFGALAAGGALGVVLIKNSVHASFSLLLSLLGTAGLFVLLNAYLLAALLVLVYAGAVVALFVFIVMLLGMQGESNARIGRFSYIGASLAFLVLLLGVAATFGTDAIPMASAEQVPAFGAQLKLYAYQLFTVYLLPVEIAGFLLLVAMIGVIVLSKKYKPEELAHGEEPAAPQDVAKN